MITKNIPYPILFYIKFSSDFQYAIKYNDEIFFSDWNKELDFNFSAINLNTLYSNIVKKIIGINDDVQDLDNEIQRQDTINRLNNEIAKFESKIRNEKQFNIKVQYNEQINRLKDEIRELNGNAREC